MPNGRCVIIGFAFFNSLGLLPSEYGVNEKLHKQDYSIHRNWLYLFIYLLLLGDSLVAQRVKHLPAMWGAYVWSLGWEDPLEKEIATHSSTLAWKILWMEKPGRLQFMGLQRVGYNWATLLYCFYFKNFKLMYSQLTTLCYFMVYSKVIQLYCFPLWLIIRYWI